MARIKPDSLLSSIAATVVALPIAVNAHGPAASAAPASPTYMTLSMGHANARILSLTARDAAAFRTAAAQAAGDVTAFSISPQAAAGFADPAFQRTWQRTDQPVASGREKRSWYWGPAPNSGGLQEEYAEGVGGKRLVQYFDKSRMEINNPAADPNNPFYVTNGLLTVELISGKMQTGNATYANRWPADIPLASDPDDASAPTYLSFGGVSNTTLGDHPANVTTGQPAIATITRAGAVGSDPSKATYPDVNFVYYDQSTRHNVPKAIWDFLNLQGAVFNPANGQTTTARLSDPWFYATGLPISEPYWARVKIAGQQQDVLIQAFQRRIVTYVPNGVPGFKVQMGNIGQHYYDWRYKDAGKPAGGTAPTPAATPTTGRPAPTNTPLPAPTNTPQPAPQDACANIPANQNAAVNPSCGEPGTRFTFSGRGFQAGENVGVYITAPDQAVYGAEFQVTADGSGAVEGIYLDTFAGIPTGLWAFTGEGVRSHNRAIGYFKIVDRNATPTPTPGTGGDTSCANTPAGQNMQILPSNCAPAGTRFLFTGRGFRPGENVGVYVTAPDQSVYGAPFQITAGSDGSAGGVTFSTQPNFPLGVWAMTMEGVQSHNRAVGYFKLTP